MRGTLFLADLGYYYLYWSEWWGGEGGGGGYWKMLAGKDGWRKGLMDHVDCVQESEGYMDRVLKDLLLSNLIIIIS